MGTICLKAEPAPPARAGSGSAGAGVNNQDPARRVQVSEEDTVMAKMKLAEDKLQARARTLEERKQTLHLKVKKLVGEKRKEESYFVLAQMKNVNDGLKSTYKKMGILDQQINMLESAKEDAMFTQVLRDSNQAIDRLNKEIDLDQLRVMKELQMEGKLRREEINEMLTDSEEDQALKAELDMIETAMLQQNFDQAKFDMEMDRLAEQTEVPEKRTQAEPTVRRSQFYQNRQAVQLMAN